MLNRFLTVVIVIPLAIVLIALAVANRGRVAFTIDPFNPGNPDLTASMPLFMLLFAALAFGIVIGSLVTWWRHGRYRKAARLSQTTANTMTASTPAAQRTSLPAPRA